VAANHQARIEVESREGEGSTFRLILPTQSEVG
jgi:signal transduction histidine kinase